VIASATLFRLLLLAVFLSEIISTRAAHRPYYGHGRIIHGSFTDTAYHIPSVFSMVLISDGTVRVMIRP
jgi:hypothetical protein